MNKQVLVVACILVCACVCFSIQAGKIEDDASTIKSKWVNWLLESTNGTSAIYWSQVYGESILSDGSWTDVGMLKIINRKEIKKKKEKINK